MVESTGLLNRRTGQTVPQVRILSSPLPFFRRRKPFIPNDLRRQRFFRIAVCPPFVPVLIRAQLSPIRLFSNHEAVGDKSDR